MNLMRALSFVLSVAGGLWAPPFALAQVEGAAPNPAALAAKPWSPPDIAKLPNDMWGELVRYGHALATETYTHIGPEAPDPAKRYAGNNFACQTCHLEGATKKFGLPLVGTFADFPQYRAREDAIGTIEERVNGCMTRSMSGRELPLDGREMKALVAYIRFLSEGIPVGAKTEGRGTPKFALPNRAADPKRGAEVYAAQCAACHGEDGQGKRRGQPGDAQGHEFPPLWGPDSYNTGAGMYRVITAAEFIRANMPFGIAYDSPALSDADAFDVAAFINSQPRPEKAGLDQDFPNRLRKPVDAPFPPWDDPFGAEQHKYGPFQPIIEHRKQRRQRESSAPAKSN